MTSEIVGHSHIEHNFLDFGHFVVSKLFFLNLIFNLRSNLNHSFTFFFERFEIWESTANFFLVGLTLSFNILTNLFYTNSSTTSFQNVFRIKLLLFNFSLSLKWFHPFLRILSFFHHFKKLLSTIFTWKLSNVIFKAEMSLNKSRWLCFFNFKVIFLNIRKLWPTLIFIKEYFNSRICKHSTLFTLFLDIMMRNFYSKTTFKKYKSMCGNNSCTVIDFLFWSFFKEWNTIGPIIYFFIRI